MSAEQRLVWLLEARAEARECVVVLLHELDALRLLHRHTAPQKRFLVDRLTEVVRRDRELGRDILCARADFAAEAELAP
jgi:hypothetical protein